MFYFYSGNSEHTSMNTSGMTPATIAELYFECWAAGDPEPLRDLLHSNVTFDGALGSTRGPEEFLEGLAGMFAATTSNVVRLRLASDEDVVTWSELQIGGKAPMQVANWTHVENGRIVAVRATFDPRPIFA
ncbi:nuclear transport factor 2 family protein [Microbacterium soli]|uniref:SnoaL-like domain-containing protein n=1 Tax=Microbacterium soli TaxID=446075 RepID=A0ABP7N2Q7_9MICO